MATTRIVSRPPTWIALGCLLLGGPHGGRASARAAEGSPSERPEILLRKAADWQLARIDDAPIDWNHAVFYLGLGALHRLTESPRDLAALERVGAAHGWRPGRRPRHADDHAIGQAYLDVYRERPDPALLAPLAATAASLVERPRPGREEWSWCDALFMAAPVWVELSRQRGDDALLTRVDEMFRDAVDSLLVEDDRLFLRDLSFADRREANGRRIFWARGNGWVLAALARILEDLPRGHPLRPTYERLFLSLAERLAELQPADGAWRPSLLDPEAHPAPETSGTALIVYGLAWGLREGSLDPVRFQPVVERGWSALIRAIQPGGRLEWVQAVGRQPAAVERGHTEPFAVGAFLLAGTEVARLELDRR